ncbi:MAG TPA: hypothetical protein VLL76_12495, partial [Candidatus Omnitrophota bacterium]|nr:hypothetical protein [Candidatus Omnitrophota bacterium]
MAANANFEVHVMRAGRWAMDCVAATESEAREVAKKLLANKQCEGARVIRNWMRADGMMVEAEIFCETRTLRDDDTVRIVAVEDAPPTCEVPAQYYGMSSRMVMNRLFRNYFEKAILTPTEVIHNYNELKRIQDKDMLVPSAVDRVATLQTRDTDQDSRVRRDDIHKNIDRMASRARRAAAMKLPKLNGRFADLHRKMAEMAEDDVDADYLSMVALSRELVTLRNWLAKLERLCGLAAAEIDPHGLELLDGVIADVLGANVVQEILGWQAGMGPAIIAMLDLADGKLLIEKSDAVEMATALNGLFAAGKLPTSRLSLLDRVHRQLRSANPLYRNDPAKENEAFARVAERLMTPTG